MGWHRINEFERHRHRFRFKTWHVVVLIIVILVIGVAIGSSDKVNVVDSLKKIFSQNSSMVKAENPNTCTQLDIPILQFSFYLDKYFGITNMKGITKNGENITIPIGNPDDVNEMEYYKNRLENNDFSDPMKEWQIANYDTIVGIVPGSIVCEKGRSEGQNPNYYYCGLEGMAYMQKTFMNPDGTIGKTIRKTFVNIYDENKKFIKTLCGDDPSIVTDRNIKEVMKEWDRFFSID